MREFWTKLRHRPWALWTSQVNTIVRIEFKRYFFSRRALWVWLLALAPFAIATLHAMFDGGKARDNMSEDTNVLAAIVQFYYLRLGIFFGTLGIFTRAIRGEMVERSLHYYLLAPVEREVLIVGKFVAGALTSLMLFEAGVISTFVMMYAHFGQRGTDFVFNGPGMGHLWAYVGVTALACVGYGAVFLLLSMMFKNPMPAAMLVLGWEFINPVMPALLQKISIMSYLRHLLPVQVPAEGLFALLTVITEPVRPWVAVVGALIVTLAVLVIACFKVRTLEINYTTD
jgi:ABC-type transport system involved in multi-copper enzyme maturation permease subunit